MWKGEKPPGHSEHKVFPFWTRGVKPAGLMAVESKGENLFRRLAIRAAGSVRGPRPPGPDSIPSLTPTQRLMAGPAGTLGGEGVSGGGELNLVLVPPPRRVPTWPG